MVPKSNPFNNLILRDHKTETEMDNAWANIAKEENGYEVLENHDHSHSKGTQHLKEYFS